MKHANAKKWSFASAAAILALSIGAQASPVDRQRYTLGNEYAERVLTVEDGVLSTERIDNKRAGKSLLPTACDEFRLRLSQGTHTTGTDVILTTRDFTCIRVTPGTLQKHPGKSIEFVLRNEAFDLTVTVRYELSNDDFFMRKQLQVVSGKPITLERVDVEAISVDDASQPYTIREITAQSDGNTKWRTGLGQPLVTTNSGTFWGIEFPAADNQVVDKQLLCGYLFGRELTAGQAYTSYKAVMGCSDDPRYLSDAFYDYIDSIRVRPLRLQIQYNSWFDFGNGVSAKHFISSVEKVNEELCVERGVPPLSAYVIDDGWQDSPKGADWSEQVWPVNEKFDPRFERSFAAVRKAKSELGLWLSPQCNFGAKFPVPSMRENKMGALGSWMSLADTPYMDMLEKRLVEFTEMGITYFKLDGLFGHLNTREFDIDGADHGVPVMPQLDTEGFTSSDKRLNDNKYDELKIYYLTVGSERLMSIFAAMSRVNPDVFIVISNGAWLSPWWLMHCDAVWMINAADAAGNSTRTDQLVYRDGIYHDIWAKEYTYFPMSALFNHEPKKTGTGESREEFQRYLYMNLSRGTGFIELYLVTAVLSESDWDVLAEGLQWARRVFPAFKHARMHGGDPRRREVYGFTGWNSEQGYLSIHNPADALRQYRVVLDRALGLKPSDTEFYVWSPLDDSLKGLKESYRYGDEISVTLEPGEIRIINFGQ